MSLRTDRNDYLVACWKRWGDWLLAGAYAGIPNADTERAFVQRNTYSNPVLVWALACERSGNNLPVKVDRCYLLLPEEMQAMALGRYLYGYAWPAIAAQLGLTLKQAEYRHTKLLEALDKSLKLPLIVEGDDAVMSSVEVARKAGRWSTWRQARARKARYGHATASA